MSPKACLGGQRPALAVHTILKRQNTAQTDGTWNILPIALFRFWVRTDSLPAIASTQAAGKHLTWERSSGESLRHSKLLSSYVAEGNLRLSAINLIVAAGDTDPKWSVG